MPVLTKIKGAVTFIKAIKHDTKDDHPQRPLIRHQNPRMNDPGTPPSPPRPPPRTILAPVSKAATPRILPGENDTLTQRSRRGNRTIKRSPEHGRSLLDRHFPANPADEAAIPHRPTRPPGSKEDAKPTVSPTPGSRSTLIPRPIATHKSTDTLRSTSSATPSPPKARVPSLPRIPHQRMHFITRLGSGGEGRCDLFRLHSPPQTLLAVKTLKGSPDLVRHKNNKRKPLEAHILQDLLPPHERIIKLHDYTHAPLATKFFMEYCSLGDLQDLLDSHFKRDTRIPEGFIWHAFLQLAEAVHHLHTAARDDKGKHVAILHRDIKPANILLRPSPNNTTSYPDIILTDFGCASHLPPHPNSTSCVGSVTFQGPELPLQNRASDIWSVGCTVHALVHGYPAMCRQPAGMRYEDWEWDPQSRVVGDVREKGYSAGLQRCVRGAMRLRWGMRWGSAQVVEEVSREMKGRRGVGEEKTLEEWACGGGGGKVKEGMVQGWEEGRV